MENNIIIKHNDIESGAEVKDDDSIQESLTSSSMCQICPICTEYIQDDDHVLACGHHIHMTCFDSYAAYKLKLQIEVTCPFCRQHLLSNQTEQAYVIPNISRSMHITQIVQVPRRSNKCKHILWVGAQLLLIAGVSFVLYLASNVKQ